MREYNEHFYEGPGYLTAYFLSLANIADNPLGVYNRQCVLNRLKVALPGEAVMVAWCDYGSYQKIFYGDIKPMADQDKLDELTRVTGAVWGDNSVPFVCDTIYNVTRETRDCVNMDKVRQSEKTVMQLMGNRHGAFYRYLMQTYENPTADAYRNLPQSEKEHWKKDYISAITSRAWIDNKLIAMAGGNWPDPDWELYHHFQKIQILGADDSETADVINLLDSHGIVPERVNAQNWKQYDRWVTEGKAKGNLTWQDFKEARDAMNEGRAVGQIYCNEIYSSLFMGSKSPGEPYWQKAPEVSCFSFDTMVRMDGGSLRRICDIRPGDRITTPHGPQKVMLVSVPLRGNRDLYQLSGHSFRFTATHPFVTEGGLACIEPAALCAAIPTFREETVRVLQAGTRLFTPSGNKLRAGQTEVMLYESGCEDELLYDVIPEPGEGDFQYYAGDEAVQYLVTSEVPSVKGREHTAQAFMIIFDQIARPILEKTAQVEEKEFWGVVQPFLVRYVKTVLPAKFALCAESETQAQLKEFGQNGEGIRGRGAAFSSYAGMFEDSKKNIRIGLLFSAAFAALLPLLMSREFSLGEADRIGKLIAGDVDTFGGGDALVTQGDGRLAHGSRGKAF